MNRRGFLGTLFGIVVAPGAIVKAVAAYSPIPVYNFTIQSIPITAKKRKLKAVWTCELQQDLENFRGIDVYGPTRTI